MSKSRVHHQRFLWADALRVLAIFLVVSTHSLSIPTPTTFGILFQTFFVSIVRIAIPLFVMLSGALLLNKKESIMVFYKKRLIKLLAPWLFWSCIYFLWNMWHMDKTYSSMYLPTKDLYRIFMSQFWFLPMLCGLYLLTPLLRYILQKNSRQIILGWVSGWIVLFSLVPVITTFIKIPSHISPYYIFEHLGYYVLGYLIITTRHLFSQTILFLLFLLCLAGQMISISAQQLSLLPEGNYIDHNASPFIILASLSLFVLSKQYFQTACLPQGVRKGITQLALLSFSIFLSHDLLRDMLSSGGVGIGASILPYPFSVVIQTSLIFFLSASIIFLLRKTRVGKYLAT